MEGAVSPGMRELEVLFGYSFPLDKVIDVRVFRARASGITALALGDEPTTLNLTLADGRRLEAKSRGRDRYALAIELVTRALAQSRAEAALAAMEAGHTFAFGEVALRPDGILFKGKVTRWENIGGYAIRQGGLLWDDVQGNLAGEVRLANVPFSDALCLALARRLPGKDYARMPPGEGPHGGVFAITARTRAPGTFKHGKHLLAGIGVLLVMAYVGNFAWRTYLDNMPPPQPSPVTVTAATVAAPPAASTAPVIILLPSAKPSASVAKPAPKAKPTANKKHH